MISIMSEKIVFIFICKIFSFSANVGMCFSVVLWLDMDLARKLTPAGGQFVLVHVLDKNYNLHWWNNATM